MAGLLKRGDIYYAVYYVGKNQKRVRGSKFLIHYQGVDVDRLMKLTLIGVEG